MGRKKCVYPLDPVSVSFDCESILHSILNDYNGIKIQIQYSNLLHKGFTQLETKTKGMTLRDCI